MQETAQYFEKCLFYKQVLDSHRPSKILCNTSNLWNFVKITGPYCTRMCCPWSRAAPWTMHGVTWCNNEWRVFVPQFPEYRKHKGNRENQSCETIALPIPPTSWPRGRGTGGGGVDTKQVVYLGWPMAPSYMSPNAGWVGELRRSQPMSTAVHRSPNKLWRSNSIFNLWYTVSPLLRESIDARRRGALRYFVLAD